MSTQTSGGIKELQLTPNRIFPSFLLCQDVPHVYIGYIMWHINIK